MAPFLGAADRAGVPRTSVAEDDDGTQRCTEAIRVLHERPEVPK
ncbi:hypothetical protein [Allokutzneria albata]|nr:hypothetical protein [Allokutzneria albata]